MAAQGLSADGLVTHMRRIQGRIRDHLRTAMLRATGDADARRTMAHAARTDGPGDTIYGIDEIVEAVLVPECEAWAAETPLLLLAEGLPPEGVPLGSGPPAFRLLVDPIDGTRGLMHDKRSGWCLMAAAPDRGADTRLSDAVAAVMTELPTTRQSSSDCLWTTAGGAALGERCDLTSGQSSPLTPTPSTASDLAHGFATVNDFTRVGRREIAEISERVLEGVLGPCGDDGDGLDCFPDQYVCCGGQLAELAMGRDRFVLDVRPEVYRHLGTRQGRGNHPYDLCTLSIAARAGVVICDPATGGPVDGPFGIEGTLSFAAYANRTLADRIQPVVARVLAEITPPCG